MTVKVLGPLDTGTEPLSPRERAILAALIVRQGTAMTPGELAEAYWGEVVPQTWGQQVKTSIARIRGRLGKDAVATRGSEYALGIDLDVIDAVRFERLVSAARQHALHGESDRAVDGYRRALGLWRGSAYPELSCWEPGVVEAMRLDEIRRSVEEELVEARLRAGDQQAVIADAERLVREQPLREGRWAILALANYQSGRQAEALATLRAARGRLLDELGIEPGARLIELETAILRQDPALDPITVLSRISQECPYRGLSAYGPDDADAYFGRDADIEGVLARAVAGAVVTVSGPSGSGKSSLVLAGVVPRLRERGRQVEIVRPGAASVSTLRWMSTADAAVEVLIVDQSEELFGVDAAELLEFCDVAAAFLAARGTVILTIRSDFLDRAAALPAVGSVVARGIFLLAPLSSSALRESIVEPARAAGLRLEPGLVELVLRDAGDRSAILPLLSHAMQETWLRREGGVLTVDGYEASGGIAGAIAQSAERLFLSLAPGDREFCRSTMLRMIERGEDGSSVRRPAASAPLLADGDRRRVIDQLVTARLVAIDGDAIMVAHEAIATAWPRLDAWLAEDAEGARISRGVESAAASWQAAGRSDDDLLRGARLQSAIEWRQASTPDLTAVEAELLDKSAQREQAELSGLYERAARERRQNRRLRWALGGSAVLLVIALVSGGIAVMRGRDASAAAENSLTEAMTARSSSLLGTNRNMAALLAVAAHARWPGDVRTRAALMGVMTAATPFIANTYIPDAAGRIGAWPVPGTDAVAVMRDYMNLEIHDINTGALLRTVSTDFADTGELVRPFVRVSADGSTILVVQHVAEDGSTGDPDDYRDELIHFFDLSSGERIGTPVRLDDDSETVDLKDDGSAATWASSGHLVVVDRDTGAVHRSPDPLIEGFDPQFAASAFLADGSVAVSLFNDKVEIVDPATLATSSTVPVAEGSGGRVMAASDDGIVVTLGMTAMSAVDIGSGAVLWSGSTEDCSRIVVSTERRMVICGDETGTLYLKDLDSGDSIGEPLDYQLSSGGDLALSVDESEVLLMSAVSPSIGTMSIDGSGPVSTNLGDSGSMLSAPLDPTGRYAILADRDQTDNPDASQSDFTVWDAKESRPLLVLPRDIEGEVPYPIVDLRWASDDELFAWFQQPESEAVSTALIDVPSGRLATADLPANVWWVFPDPEGEIVYVSLWDDPSTATTEPSELRTYDADTWERLPVTMDVGDKVEHLSVTADHTRIVATEGGAHPTTLVFDGDGNLITTGLPATQATVVLDDATLVGGSAEQLDLFDSESLDRKASLPSNPGWTFNLSASTDRLVLAQGYGKRGLLLIDVDSGRSLGGSLDTYSSGGMSWLSADGSGFVTTSNIGTQWWTLDEDAQAAAACRLAGREPTAEEWHTNFAEFGDQVRLCEDSFFD